MSNLLDTVNRRTQLAGQNRLELLLFQLSTPQPYGINVFKVKEVIHCLPLTVIPKSHPAIRGLTHIRGVTVPIIDLNMAIGGGITPDPERCFVIITEYNQSVQGFLVSMVQKIVNMKWEDIHAPPPGIKGSDSYLTAVTQVDNRLVEIIDVEKILQEIAPLSSEVSAERQSSVIEIQTYTKSDAHSRVILVVDDSAVARNQIKKTMENIGIEVILKNNGKEGLEILKQWADAEENLDQKLLMVISDIEMPEMDGYTLATEIRADSRLKDLFVVLHTSLSGVFNSALVEKVGANRFLPKFKPDSLVEMVKERIHTLQGIS
jgi:two-component system chemotaxis response regulator CheV